MKATLWDRIRRVGRWSLGLLASVTMWLYFTIGFVLLFGPCYLWAELFSSDRATRFRQLNCRFYRSFFGLVRLLMPHWRWRIDPRVRALRGSLIVCNHVSHLDPILLISLFGKHTTIAKGSLFAIPGLGWVLRSSGYVPTGVRGELAGLMVERMEALPAEVAAGTNLFVFPEGTRSRDGTIGAFHNSVFKIAQRMGRPIQVLAVQGSEGLLPPGRFAFNAMAAGTVVVDWVGEVAPPSERGKDGIAAMMTATRGLLENHLQQSREPRE